MDKRINIIEAFINDERFSKTTRSLPARKLDVPALVKAGAIRITYEADGKGGYIDNEDPESFTVVSLINDMNPKSLTRNWPNKPRSLQAANRIINGKQPDGKTWLDDGKRAQIETSAELVGMAKTELYS